VTITLSIRKTVTYIENVAHDGGPPPAKPLRKGAIAAIVANPFAGRYAEDLSEWLEALAPLGDRLAQELLDAMGVPAAEIESFGKGAIVGVNGDIEAGAAWHPTGGGGLKRLLGVPGFVTAGQIIGNVGAHLHIPLVSVYSPWVRSHFDSVDISVADGPRPDEILFALAMANGGRIHARLGGVTFDEGKNGSGPAF
jgi:Amino acid synthesis